MDTDAEGSTEILNFRIAQAIHAGIFKHAWDTAAPPFNDVHVLKRRADGNVTNAGIAFNQLVDGQIGAQPTRGCDFQTIIIDRNLDGTGRQI